MRLDQVGSMRGGGIAGRAGGGLLTRGGMDNSTAAGTARRARAAEVMMPKGSRARSGVALRFVVVVVVDVDVLIKWRAPQLDMLSLLAQSSAQLCSSGTIGHVHYAADPTSSSVLASVCCPKTCTRCGGVDCWSQPGGLDCCARHVYEQGRQCTGDQDAGCVLPKPTAIVLPAQQRERACLDLWSAAFPNERQDWAKRSCRYKVEWKQCNQFYAPCQCSCGYCAPTRAFCDPREAAAHAPPPSCIARSTAAVHSGSAVDAMKHNREVPRRCIT